MSLIQQRVSSTGKPQFPCESLIWSLPLLCQILTRTWSLTRDLVTSPSITRMVTQLSVRHKVSVGFSLCLQDKTHTSGLISAWNVLSCCVWNMLNTYATSAHAADSCKTTSECFPFDSSFGHKQSCISKSLLPVEYHTSRILHSSSQIIFFHFLIFFVPCGIQ